MGVVSGFILSSLIVTLAYLFGVLIFLKDHEVNRCEMTYMYEYPQFVRIKLDTDHRFRKYGLYAYSEGRFTYNARNMKFTGIPILFIPGNAGSYRQVRSLASVCLRKSLDDRPGFHFDFFTVNLNDEFSGLNGALLQEQTEYVNRSIYQILKLYPKTRPKNIILFGHSMGGVIARGLLTVLEDRIVPLIITLASPHSRPPLMLDSYMLDYYHRIRMGNKAVNSTIVSLSGGYNDYLIIPFITTATYLDILHVFSTSVPLVWLPMDHLCILWCKQLVLVIARGLFDAVDFNTKQISHDPEYLRAVFHHHLVNNNGIKIRKSIQSSHLTQSVTFARGRNDWIENLQKQYTISSPHGVQQMQYHMLRILGDADYQYLTIVALNVDVVEWVFACSATKLQGQRRICSDGIHLSHLTEISPSVRYRRRLLKLDTQELKRHYTELTHIIVRLLPTSRPVTIQIDRYFEPERTLTVKTLSWFSFQRQLLLNETREKTLYYKIIMPQLTHVIQAYVLYVDLIKCSNKVHHATASLKVPWGNQNTHKHFTEEDTHPFQIRLHNSRPITGGNESASLQLTLDPLCQYSVSVRYDILGSMGQIVRIYTPLLLPNIVVVILLTFRNQILGIEATGRCSMFFKAAQYGIKPYYLLPIVKLASQGLSWKKFSSSWVTPDWYVITEEGNDFLLLPLILYMSSVGIVWLAALVISVSLIFYEATFHKLVCKFLARTLMGSQKLSGWILSVLYKLPGIVAIILVLLSITTCGGLSLCIGCVFYFLRLTQMSQDYIEQLVVTVLKYFARQFRRNPASDASQNTHEDDTQKEDSSPQGEECTEIENKLEELVSMDDSSSEESKVQSDQTAEKSVENNNQMEEFRVSNCDGIFFHFSIFMMWCIMAGLSVPSVLTWAHNFKYSIVLRPDPSFVPGLLLSICALPLWHMDLPKTEICGYSYLGQIFTLLVGGTLIYSSVFLHRLNYIITFAIVLVTCHQMLAPKYEFSVDSDMNNTTIELETETSSNDVKAKLE